MKEKLRILGIIAIVAIIGFSMVACDGEDDCEHEWEVVVAPYLGEVGKAKCELCEGEEDIAALGKDVFYGTWKGTGSAAFEKWTIIIEADTLAVRHDDYPIASNPDSRFDFEITDWGSIISNTRENSNGPAATYAKGYKLTGTTTSTAATSGYLDLPKQTEIELYLHVSDDRMWIFWGTAAGSGISTSNRTFIKQ